MTKKSLEDVLKAAGNTVSYLRNMQTGPNVYPGVPPEYTNWRDEQYAWQHTCVLFNQSYHMADLLVTGPDAFDMLQYLVTPDGYVIGDVILFYLGENTFNLVGRIPVLNWVMFHADTGDWNVKYELDERSAARPDPLNRKSYRYQIQGPNAMKLMRKVVDGEVPELKFFNMCELNIAGKKVDKSEAFTAFTWEKTDKAEALRKDAGL